MQSPEAALRGILKGRRNRNCLRAGKNEWVENVDDLILPAARELNDLRERRLNPRPEYGKRVGVK
jgi:hypothetical protein